MIEKGGLKNPIWRTKYSGGRTGRTFGLTGYGRKGEVRVKDMYLAAARAI